MTKCTIAHGRMSSQPASVAGRTWHHLEYCNRNYKETAIGIPHTENSKIIFNGRELLAIQLSLLLPEMLFFKGAKTLSIISIPLRASTEHPVQYSVMQMFTWLALKKRSRRIH